MDGIEWRFLSADEMAMPPPREKPGAITQEDLETIVQQRLDHSLMLSMDPSMKLSAEPETFTSSASRHMAGRVATRVAGTVVDNTSVSFNLSHAAGESVSLLGGGTHGDGTSMDRYEIHDDDDESMSTASSAGSSHDKGGRDQGTGAEKYSSPQRRKRTELTEEDTMTPAEKKIESVFKEHTDMVDAKKKALEEDGVTANVGSGAPIVLWRPPNEVRITQDIPAELLKNAISQQQQQQQQRRQQLRKNEKDKSNEVRCAERTGEAATDSSNHDVQELSPEEAAAELKAREKEADDKRNAAANTQTLLARIRSESPDIPKARKHVVPAAPVGDVTAPTTTVKRHPVPPSQGTRRFARTGGRGSAVRYKACVVQHPRQFVVTTKKAPRGRKAMYGLWFVPPKYWQSPSEEPSDSAIGGTTTKHEGNIETARTNSDTGSNAMVGSSNESGRRATTKPPPVKQKHRSAAETYWDFERKSHDRRKEKLDKTLPSLFISRQYTQWLADSKNNIERIPAWCVELARRIQQQQQHPHQQQHQKQRAFK